MSHSVEQGSDSEHQYGWTLETRGQRLTRRIVGQRDVIAVAQVSPILQVEPRQVDRPVSSDRWSWDRT
jgi:hypothetical protein